MYDKWFSNTGQLRSLGIHKIDYYFDPLDKIYIALALKSVMPWVTSIQSMHVSYVNSVDEIRKVMLDPFVSEYTRANFYANPTNYIKSDQGTTLLYNSDYREKLYNAFFKEDILHERLNSLNQKFKKIQEAVLEEYLALQCQRLIYTHALAHGIETSIRLYGQRDFPDVPWLTHKDNRMVWHNHIRLEVRDISYTDILYLLLYGFSFNDQLSLIEYILGNQLKYIAKSIIFAHVLNVENGTFILYPDRFPLYPSMYCDEVAFQKNIKKAYSGEEVKIDCCQSDHRVEVFKGIFHGEKKINDLLTEFMFYNGLGLDEYSIQPLYEYTGYTVRPFHV